VHWASTGIKLSLVLNKFGAKLSLPCPFFFLNAFNRSLLLLCVHTVAINVLEPGAFNPESQYFIPLFNKKFHYFADNSQKGMKHQMRGATQAQPGMTLGTTLLCVLNREFGHFILRFSFKSLLCGYHRKRGLGVKGGPKTENSIV